MSTQRGQSLIEVLIVLAITAVVILALVVASLMGLKNAQFAQNQSKATKYAQDAMDQVKAIRDRDGQIIFESYVADPSTCNSNAVIACGDGRCNFSDLWSCKLSQRLQPTPTPCRFCFAALNINSRSPCSTQIASDLQYGCYFLLASGSLEEAPPPNPNSRINEELEDGAFLRQIFMEDNFGTPASDWTKEKRVTVRVIWSDGSGSHESMLQTILTKH